MQGKDDHLTIGEIIEKLLNGTGHEEPVGEPREAVLHGKVIDVLDVTILPANTVIYSEHRGWWLRDQDGDGFTDIGTTIDPEWFSDETMKTFRDEDWRIVSVPTAWIPTYLEEYLRFAYKENG